MPIYEYKCELCDHGYEIELAVKDSTKYRPCERCQADARRMISWSSFVLKGSGWSGDSFTLDSEKPHDEAEGWIVGE